ncbi:MAG TPA: GNAT family N-acetyltransferase [Candidatus Saccharimonadales bacterium]|jgi:tagatose 1,6-diphosphate aldolase|nr:GNAT family N-acetyltransferase [Candidatus Saccharimonadales bacterium]
MLAGKLIDGDLELRFLEKRKVMILKSCAWEFVFEMYLLDTNQKIGAIRLRLKLTPDLEEYGGHVEYEVDKKFRGNNFAARSFTLLLPLFRKIKINPIIITCDPTNIASIKTIEKIGGKLVSAKNIRISSTKKRKTNKYFVYNSCERNR